MVRFVRRTGLATLGGLILSVPAHAQQQPVPPGDSVGPPALSNFELRPDDQAASPPESGPTIAPLAPPPAGGEPRQQAPASEPVVTIAPPPAPVTEAPAPERMSMPDRAPAPAPSGDRRISDVHAPAPVEQAPAIADDLQPAPESVSPASPAPAPVQSDPVPDQTAILQPESGGLGLWWLYLLAAGLVIGAGYAAFRRKTRVAPAMAGRATMPAPEPELTMPPPPPAQTRPWIELEFRPSEAGANDNQAAIKFELMLRNVGEGEARDVRVESRMFNAGATQDKEISSFFSRPGPNSVTAPVSMQPQTQIPYRSVVHLPRDKVREINVRGRRLFIPMVAFNVRYRWGETEWGQTSASYLVGVENNPPAEKMGAFRLDLGPRIYRKVGQREHSLSRRI